MLRGYNRCLAPIKPSRRHAATPHALTLWQPAAVGSSPHPAAPLTLRVRDADERAALWGKAFVLRGHNRCLAPIKFASSAHPAAPLTLRVTDADERAALWVDDVRWQRPLDGR